MAEKNRLGSRRRLRLLLSVLAALTVLACVGALLLYLTRPKGQVVKPMTREELVQLLDPAELDRLSAEERKARLADCGARLGMMDKATRDALIADLGTWKIFFSLPPEERIAIMMAAMPNRMEQEMPAIRDFFEVPPEEQEKLLDERINHMLWVRGMAKLARRMGMLPDPAQQRENFRGYLYGLGEEGRDQLFRTMLNNASAEDRAMVQEYRRRMRERAEERGVDWQRIQRGE